MNKKGSVLMIGMFALLSLIAIYCLLFLPIPAFTKLRTIINYFLLIIFWVLLQAGFVYFYVKVIQFALGGFGKIRATLMKFSLSMRQKILTYT